MPRARDRKATCEWPPRVFGSRGHRGSGLPGRDGHDAAPRAWRQHRRHNATGVAGLDGFKENTPQKVWSCLHGLVQGVATIKPSHRPDSLSYCAKAVSVGLASVSVHPAFEGINIDCDPRIVLVCDHASNFIPASYGDLGLHPGHLATHIAWDIGAADVTRSLARSLSAPAILATHSRLLIDLNRGEDDPTLVMKLSDGAIIPGNARVDGTEIEARLQAFYRPYHAAISALLVKAMRHGTRPVIVSVHSFTPHWKGRSRPWHVGVLWSRRDQRLSGPLLNVLKAEPDLCVGDNQPYSGELVGDCMDRHALANGLPHVLLELRQDLVATPEGAHAWAKRLKPLLLSAIAGMKPA